CCISPQVYLATTRAEILAGQQSKYVTVSMNQCIREIWKHGKDKKFAFVGLGCHLQGLRKAERRIPKLKERIVLRIGLFCGHNMNVLGTKHLLRLVNVSLQDVEYIEYRAKEWPGNFLVRVKDGGERTIRHPHWTSYVLTLYEKWRCRFCIDPLNQLADISLGDPWLKELSGNKGENVIITRTTQGVKFLRGAVSKGLIKISYLPPEKVIESQKRILYRKKHLILAYMRLARRFGYSIPEYTGLPKEQKLLLHDCFTTISLEVLRCLAAKQALQAIVPWFGKMYINFKDYARGFGKA
ncbi:MAG: Coenzyme F420 hydrogenase/dehydrogenase, beta subunit C-terminal domain, partial [Candidatus Hodarchaeota archaeon]